MNGDEAQTDPSASTSTPATSPQKDVVSSSSKTATGVEKLKSMFKNFQNTGDGTPKKSVKFEIPDDIKKLYADDPDVENYLVEELQNVAAQQEEQLRKLNAERKARAAKITADWQRKLQQEEEDRKAAAAEKLRKEIEDRETKLRVQKEAEEAAAKKHQALEEEIRKRVVAEKQQKIQEAEQKEKKRQNLLVEFKIENKIRKEHGMEELPLPPELLDTNIPETLKKPEDIKKENVSPPAAKNQKSTPPAPVSVSDSVKRRILPDGQQTPTKKLKKDNKSTVQNTREFAALLLSPNKRKLKMAQSQAEEDYKMLCKMKMKLMLEADSFLNLEHGETELDSILSRVFELCFEIDKSEAKMAQKDSFYRLMKHHFDDLGPSGEDAAVEKMRWRLSMYTGDNLTTWSNVSLISTYFLTVSFSGHTTPVLQQFAS